MEEQSRVLAEKLEQAVSDFIATVEGLAEEQWQTLYPNEGRSIGALVCHLSCGGAVVMAMPRENTDGVQPDTVSRAELAMMNARDAQVWKHDPKDEKLALLRGNAAAAAAKVRQLAEERSALRGRHISDNPARGLPRIGSSGCSSVTRVVTLRASRRRSNRQALRTQLKPSGWCGRLTK